MALLRRGAAPAHPVEVPWFVLGVGSPARRTVAAPSRSSVVVLGEPGTGKSSGFVQVNALPWRLGPCLVRSTRPDNRDRVLGPLLDAGRHCLLLHLDSPSTAPTGCAEYRVSLLDRATSWSASRELALRLVRAVREPGVRPDSTQLAFEDYAAEALGALLHAAALSRRCWPDTTLLDVARWYGALRAGLEPAHEALRYPREILRELGGPEGLHALGGLENVAEHRSNRHDTIQKVSEAVGHLFTGAALQALATADRAGGTDPIAVVRSGATVFIEVSGDHPVRSRSHSGLASLVEDELADAARAVQRQGSTGPPLRVLYDESATGCVNPNIPSWAATGGGDGIALMLCAQSLDQLERVFPVEGAGLVNVFTHRVFLRGHALRPDQVAQMFGRYQVERLEHGGSRSLFGLPHRTWTTRHELLPRVTPDLLVGMPDGCGLLASRDHIGPIRIVPSFAPPWSTQFPS